MLIAVVVALAAGLLLQPLVIRVLTRRGVLDAPSARSSHVTPTVRGGGIGVVVAFVVAAAAADALSSREALLVVLSVVACAAVGLAEDLHGVGVKARFLLLLVACVPLALVALEGPGGAAAAAVAVVFGVAAVNATNFMDGINGISAAQGVVGGIAAAVVGATQGHAEIAVLGAALAAAAASFAPFNVPRAKVFLGDTGSYGLGAALAGLAVALVAAGVPLEAALAPLAIYGADTAVTLLRRVRTGEAWHLPHRTHVYQRLTDLGLSHVQVSGIVLGFAAACSVLGTGSLGPAPVRVAADAALAAVVVTYLVLPSAVGSRRKDRSA